jgi:hypothetical protein
MVYETKVARSSTCAASARRKPGCGARQPSGPRGSHTAGRRVRAPSRRRSTGIRSPWSGPRGPAWPPWPPAMGRPSAPTGASPATTVPAATSAPMVAASMRSRWPRRGSWTARPATPGPATTGWCWSSWRCWRSSWPPARVAPGAGCASLAAVHPVPPHSQPPLNSTNLSVGRTRTVWGPVLLLLVMMSLVSSERRRA